MSQKLYYILAAALAALFLITGTLLRVPLRSGVAGETSVSVRGITPEEMMTGNDPDYSGYPTELLPGTMININTATSEELQQLPGIGPALSESISEYRAQNGPFAAIEDIMLVKGIAEGKFADIRDHITVGDD